MRHKKHRSIRLKWKLFAYLACFTGLLIVLLWLFQIVFLNSFYKQIKTQDLKRTAETLASSIDSDAETLQDLVNRLSLASNALIALNDDSGALSIRTTDMQDPFLFQPEADAMQALYREVRENGGSASQILTPSAFAAPPAEERHSAELSAPDDNSLRQPESSLSKPHTERRDDLGRRRIETLVLVSRIDRTGQEPVMMTLMTTITPIDSTVETLRVQLLIITAILLVPSVLLALLMSRRISAPIRRLSGSARELAQGNYDVPFDGKGYLEISELNDTLSYAACELGKTDKLRRELIANVSHDLRTPLTMITGYGEIMRDIPGENTPENADIIVSEAARLSDLVTDMLDLSKFQSGAAGLSLSRFNLTQSVRDILLRMGRMMEKEGYHITFSADCDVLVDADCIKISQVIYNLVGNAVNHTGPNRDVAVVQTIADGRVRIAVQDSGTGIPPEELDRIWERYYRIDKARKRDRVGTGLGLSIVRSILELHHAEYGVTSTVGQGSIFYFELSAAEVLPPQPGNAAAQSCSNT